MSAKSRYTKFGKAVEHFIDANAEHLSPKLFAALEELALEVDGLGEEMDMMPKASYENQLMEVVQ